MFKLHISRNWLKMVAGTGLLLSPQRGLRGCSPLTSIKSAQRQKRGPDCRKDTGLQEMRGIDGAGNMDKLPPVGTTMTAIPAISETAMPPVSTATLEELRSPVIPVPSF